jgi:hypothetical protein
MPEPVEGVPEAEVFVQVVAGENHCAALTVNGEVWSWGCYKDGDGKTFFHGEECKQTILQVQSVKSPLPLCPPINSPLCLSSAGGGSRSKLEDQG